MIDTVKLAEALTDVIAKRSEDDKALIRIGYALYKDNKVKTITDAYTRTLGDDERGCGGLRRTIGESS